MRKSMFFWCILLSIVFVGINVYAGEEIEFTSEYYRLVSNLNSSETELLALELDMRFEAYNQICRLADPSSKGQPLNVRVFDNREAYSAYLQEEIGQTQAGSIYIHYSNSEKSQLLVIRDDKEDRSFSHQSFIQYLRAAIPYPPAWLREGLAIYFDSLQFNREIKSLVYEENLAWLETVKSWASPPTAEELMRHDFMDSGLDSKVYAPAAWALVSFFLNSDSEEYRRSFYEMLVLLDPFASAPENASLLLSHLASYSGIDNIEKAYTSYINSRQTFAALIESGRAAYAVKNLELAEYHFLDAANLRPNHHAPFYYLGLLAYENRQFEQAEQFYLTARNLGAHEGLISFALGVNSLANNKKDEARSWLEKAREIDYEKYNTKVEELLQRF